MSKYAAKTLLKSFLSQTKAYVKKNKNNILQYYVASKYKEEENSDSFRFSRGFEKWKSKKIKNVKKEFSYRQIYIYINLHKNVHIKWWFLWKLCRNPRLTLWLIFRNFCSVYSELFEIKVLNMGLYTQARSKIFDLSLRKTFFYTQKNRFWKKKAVKNELCNFILLQV